MNLKNRDLLIAAYMPLKQTGFYDGIYDENVIVPDIEEDDIVLDDADVEQDADDDGVCVEDCENESVVDDDLIVTQVMQELHRREVVPLMPLPHSSPMAQA